MSMSLPVKNLSSDANEISDHKTAPVLVEQADAEVQTPDEPARSRVQVIDRAVRLMSVMSEGHDPVSLKQLCEKTGLHSATAHRILASLCIHGLVERVGDQRFYCLGKGLTRVVKDQDTRKRVTDVAVDRMRTISEETQATVRLMFRQNRELVCVSQFQRGVMQPYPGFRCALHVNPVGKLWLGHLGETYVRRYVESLELALLKQQNITFPQLWSEVVGTVVRGFALERTDSSHGIVTLGVLVRNHLCHPVAALTLAGEQSRIDTNAISKLRKASTHITDTAFVSGEFLTDLVGV